MKNNKCLLILPYFGNFNNYFPIFLKSCSMNDKFDWLIVTDNADYKSEYSNIKFIFMTLDELKKKIEKKIGFNICLKNPYKLCDYKPTYGFIFDEFVKDYDYWGHCDCDLIFGNLNKILIPIMEKNYDKIFAAGHLTLYKNSEKNNRRFMNKYKGRYLYKEAFTTDEIFVFDEDCVNHDNVHYIFKCDNAKIFDEDLSMNVSIAHAKFVRDKYDNQLHKFITQPYIPMRIYWSNGDLQSLHYEKNSKKIVKNEYIYIHLQKRKIVKYPRVDSKLKCFEILPDRFILRDKVKNSNGNLHLLTIGFPYSFWINKIIKKLKNKI